MKEKNVKDVSYIDYVIMEREMLNDFGRTEDRCDGVDCNECPLNTVNCDSYDKKDIENKIKIVLDYISNVQWHRKKKNTLVYVWNKNNEDKKYVRYFAYFKDNIIYTYKDGKTSFTVDDKLDSVEAWDCGELYTETE